MDYTVNLKKILTEKQFVFLQSVCAFLRTAMSPELFNHSIGTLNYCFKMAYRFLLNGAGSDLNDAARAEDGFFECRAVAGDLNDFASAECSDFKDPASAGGISFDHFEGDTVFEDYANIVGPEDFAVASGINSHAKTIPELCFNLASAALLHDYGKIFSFEELKAIAVKEKLSISDFELCCEPILHGFVAPFLLERDFKIKGRDILNSVRIHTIGSVKMSITDKILYIADKIEQTRNYEGVEKLRKLSLENINMCLLEVYKSNIIYIIKGNNVLHPDSAKIWNYIHGGLKNAI